MSETHPSSGKSFKDKINNNALRNSRFIDLAAPYDVGFNELDVKVIPQLEEINFYGGYRAPEYDYVPESSHAPKRRSKMKHGLEAGRLRKIDDILKTFDSGQITFTGQAGSGKTTLLKLITRDVLCGKYDSLKEVEIVHSIQCKDLLRTDMVTLEELLFHSTDDVIKAEDRRNTMKYATEYPGKILFVLDSLDTLQFTIDGVYKNVSIEERASPEAILWNFLSGNLFPGCRIITSSREHSIRNYMGEVRANHVIAVVGLTTDSMKQIIIGYIGEEEAEEVMTFLERKSPSLLYLCSSPALLVFTLIGLKSGANFTPSTMSRIMALVLECLIRSPHAHEENIEVVIAKLLKLAFDGTEQKRVLFSVDELTGYELKTDEVRDLTILVPGGLTQKVLLGSQVLFFAHQMFQEWLAAIHIARMEPRDFTTFVSTSLHTPHYAIIRRFLCGILMDEEVSQACEQFLTGDLPEKRDTLTESFREQIRTELRKGSDSDPHDQLELFLSINEASSEMKRLLVPQTVAEIKLEEVPLSTSDVHSVASFISICDHLENLSLKNCNIDGAAFKLMENILHESNVKIGHLFLGESEGGDDEWFRHLGNLLKKYKEAEISVGGYITYGNLDSFRRSLDATKIRIEDAKERHMTCGPITANIIAEHSRGIAQIHQCDIGIEEMERILETAMDGKLSVSGFTAHNIGDIESFRRLGFLAAKCEGAVIRSYPDIDIHELDSLLQAFGTSCEISEVIFNHMHGIDISVKNSDGTTIHVMSTCELGRIYGEIDSMELRQDYVHFLQEKILDILWPSTPKVIRGYRHYLQAAYTTELQLKSTPEYYVRKIQNDGDVEDLLDMRISTRILIFEVKLGYWSEARYLMRHWTGWHTVHIFRRHHMQEILEELIDLFITLRIKEFELRNGFLGTHPLTKYCVIFHQANVDLWQDVREYQRQRKKIAEANDTKDQNVDPAKQHERAQYVPPTPSSQAVETLSAMKERPTRVTAKKLLGGIHVSWSNARTGSTDHLIQVYCDGRKLGEPVNVEGTEYHLSSPLHSKIYFFEVWAYNASGMDGEKVRSNAISVHRIDEDGGDVTIDGCSITFPKHCFNEESAVWTTIDHDATEIPDEYIAITSLIDVDSEYPFLKPVKIKLPTWCSSDGSDRSKNVTIDILHKLTGTKSWDVIQTIPLPENGVIEFDCKHFSPIFAGLSYFLWGPQEVDIKVRLYIVRNQELHFVFYLKDSGQDTIVRQVFEELQGSLCQHFNVLTVKPNDTITVKPTLTCDGSPVPLNNEQISFTVDKKFTKDKVKMFNFIIEAGRQREYQDVIVKPTILVNDCAIEEGEHDFTLPRVEGTTINPGQQHSSRTTTVQIHEAKAATSHAYAENVFNIAGNYQSTSNPEQTGTPNPTESITSSPPQTNAPNP